MTWMILSNGNDASGFVKERREIFYWEGVLPFIRQHYKSIPYKIKCTVKSKKIIRKCCALHVSSLEQNKSVL